MTAVDDRPAAARIVLVEDHALFAEALAVALRIEGYDANPIPLGEHRCGAAGLVHAIVVRGPALVLLDLNLGGQRSGVELIAPLAAELVPVLVVTGSADERDWGECIALGAKGVVPKSLAFGDVLRAIRRVSNGLEVMSPDRRADLVRLWKQHLAADGSIRRRFDRLTRREAEVLSCLMSGRQVAEIAHARTVAESTVRTQVKSVLAKLGVSSQLTAVGLAHQADWSPPPCAYPLY